MSKPTILDRANAIVVFIFTCAAVSCPLPFVKFLGGSASIETQSCLDLSFLVRSLEMTPKTLHVHAAPHIATPRASRVGQQVDLVGRSYASNDDKSFEYPERIL